MRAIDAYCGAGGLSSGLAEAGFEVEVALDKDAAACETYRALHSETEVREAELNPQPLKGLARRVALVAAGPPCQPFSSGGKQLAKNDPRDGMPALLEVVKSIAPAAVLIENVAGLASPACENYLRSIIEQLEDLEFDVAWKILNAADYGVPQNRSRLFVVGVKGPSFKFPPPTHGPERRWRWKTAGEALAGPICSEHKNGSVITFAKNPHLRKSPFSGLLFNGGGRPLDLKRPGRTVLASAGGNRTDFLDPEGVAPEYHQHLMSGGDPREGSVPGAIRLGAYELAALQSFSSSVRFHGTTSQVHRQIGNAVPPKLAAAVARKLFRHLQTTGAVADRMTA